MSELSNTKKYEEIFDYLSAPQLPTSPEASVVFGRKDTLVAKAIGELAMVNLADIIVITGGIGKDSGDLLASGFRSEAHYLSDQLTLDAKENDYELPKVLLDENASNGAENARNSLALLDKEDRDLTRFTAVAHATSAKRLAEMLKHETVLKTDVTPTVFIKPSSYTFHADREEDQKEAGAELLRLADWPNKGWLQKQNDLPEDLVEFVRDTNQ